MTGHLPSFTAPTRIVLGPGARHQVAEEVAALGAGHVLIVADATTVAKLQELGIGWVADRPEQGERG